MLAPMRSPASPRTPAGRHQRPLSSRVARKPSLGSPPRSSHARALTQTLPDQARKASEPSSRAASRARRRETSWTRKNPESAPRPRPRAAPPVTRFDSHSAQAKRGVSASLERRPARGPLKSALPTRSICSCAASAMREPAPAIVVKMETLAFSVRRAPRQSARSAAPE